MAARGPTLLCSMKSPATAKVAADDIAKATGTSFGDDPIAAIMSKYDKDGNGTFDVNECATPIPGSPLL